MSEQRVCSRKDCEHKGKPQPFPEAFNRHAASPTGYRYHCRSCDARRRKEYAARNRAKHSPMPVDPPAPDEFEIVVEAPSTTPVEDPRRKRLLEQAEKERREQQARLKSDYAALKPEDFDVSVGNIHPEDVEEDAQLRAERRQASKEKRQEWNRQMGEFAEALQTGGGDPAQVPAEVGTFIGNLAEQERRFGNRRLSRSVSLAAAHAELARQFFKATAEQYFNGLIVPTGWALKGPGAPKKRTVVVHFSDLHFGAEMDERGNPLPYRAVEEARRFEYVVRQALDYKPQYREDSQLQVLIDGDVIDGFLQHDQRAGLPLAEQKAVFWHHFSRALGLFAQAYPRVLVECQPGNHGRNIARHPGRATEDKWDGIEWDMYFALERMASRLPNVTFNLPFRAVSIVQHYGQVLGVTHGDTEVKLGDPDTKSRENAAALDRINATQLYGVSFDAWAFGHFHKARYQPRNPRAVFNGALVPPNGHARTSGYIGEPCGQFIWEWTEGYPVGDLRFIEVGQAQDRDDRLGTLIEPFRFAKASAAVAQ